MSIFEGLHLILVTIDQCFPLSVFVQDFELTKSLPGSLSLIQLALLLADLAMLLQDLEEVVSDEIGWIRFLSIKI